MDRRYASTSNWVSNGIASSTRLSSRDPGSITAVNGADALTRLGYTNVRKYREGIEDWAAAGLPLESGQFVG